MNIRMGFALSALLLVLHAAPVCAVQYEAVALSGRKATCINNSGQIVGLGPCIYDSAGVPVRLSTPPPPTQGSAYAISDSGRIVGFYFGSMDTRVAAYWCDSTTRVDLSAPPTRGECYGINSSDVMCGTYGGAPVTYSASGSHTDLAVGNGNLTIGAGLDINNSGLVAGYLGTNLDSNQIAVWNTDGSIRYLGPWGQARAINNDGIVGGTTGSPFLWTSAGGLQTLSVASGYSGGEVNGLNDHGIAVGAIYLHGPGIPANTGSPALWDVYGSVIILPTPIGYTWATALSINEAGQIVGTAYAIDQVAYRQTAVLWTPIPESSSLIALFCGLGALVLPRKRC